MRAQITKIIMTVTIIMVALCLLGCGKATEPGSNFVYPLAVGNQWEYTIESEVYNILGDSAAVEYIFKIGSQGNAIMATTGTAMIADSIETYVMRASTIYDDVVNLDGGRTYLNNRADGLYIFYSDNRLGMDLHKPIHICPLPQTHDRLYLTPAELMAPALLEIPGVNSEVWPRPAQEETYLTLAYPLAINKSWVASELIDDRIIRKTITGFSKISVPAGDFQAYAIRTEWESSYPPTGYSYPLRYDYISAEGLIKRVIYNYDIYVMDENANLIGIVDIRTTVALTSLMLH